MDSVLIKARDRYKGKVEVIKVDINDRKNMDLAEKYRVRLMPTLVFLNESGEVHTRYEGVISIEDIEKVMEEMGVK